MIKHPWMIENIQFSIDNEKDFLNKFAIYDDLNLLSKSIFKIIENDDFVNVIKNSQIDTGIIVSSLKINSELIYLCIFDNEIFIIKQINLPKFKEYFNEHLNSLIFMTSEIKENFFNAISSKIQISEQNDQNIKSKKEINRIIADEIIRCTIKKSQYRTIKMRSELLPNEYNCTNDKKYKLDDFFQLNFNVYYNSKDQILNFLKSYKDEKRFKHEINFYNQIENTFPFICKIFGIIKQSNKLPIIILEYVEGETLYNFILSDKKIDFNTKIKIIEEILFSVYYIHSNGFYLRDLKPDNIIIDSGNNAILIDFDSSKEINSSNEEENTIDIGSFFFAAPEQNDSFNYTYKVDSYSIGMIIYFIITGQKINLNYYDLPKEYDFILYIYKKCFEISPSSRPSIKTLIHNILFNNNELKKYNETEQPYIINQLEKYESRFKISYKCIHEDIEQSYLQFFFRLYLLFWNICFTKYR